MNTQTTLPEQLRLAAEIIEKKLLWEYKQCGTWLASRTSDSPVYTILSGMEIRLAKPPAPEVAQDDADKPAFDLAAHVISNGFRALFGVERWMNANEWTAEMLPHGTRPALVGEPQIAGDEWQESKNRWASADGSYSATAEDGFLCRRTRRPLPGLPASTQGKSLGKVAEDAYNAALQTHESDSHEYCMEHAAQAVAAEVSRLHAEEVARLKGERNELQKDVSALCAALDAHDVTEAVMNAKQQKIMLTNANKYVEHLKTKISNQRTRLNYLEGATHHAGGTPLSQALARISGLERELKERTATDHLVDANKMIEEPAWIEHDGGECPLVDSEVEEWEVRYRDGGEESFVFPPSKAEGWEKTEEDVYTHYRVKQWKPGYTATTITGPDGKVYTRHKPGDAQPVADDVMVYCLGDNVSKDARKAKDWYWGDNTYAGITGWRYADAEAKVETVPLEKPEPFNESKWIWMMEWCRKQGFAPANHSFWTEAEKQYNASQNPPN